MTTEPEEIISYLARRLVSRHAHPRWTGVSSDAMLAFALGAGPRPLTPGTPTSHNGYCWINEECGENYPHDLSDLEACELTYERAPASLQISMFPVLEEFRAWVLEGRNRYGEWIQERKKA